MSYGICIVIHKKNLKKAKIRYDFVIVRIIDSKGSRPLRMSKAPLESDVIVEKYLTGIEQYL